MPVTRTKPEDELRQPQTSALDQIPSSTPTGSQFVGTTPQAPSPLRDTEIGRNINNGLNALGPIGVVASVPLRAGQAASRATQVAEASQPLLSAPNAAPLLSGGNRLRTIPEAAPQALQAADNVIGTLPGTNAALQTGALANRNAALVRTASGANAAAAGSDGLAFGSPSTTPASTGPLPGPNDGPPISASGLPILNGRTGTSVAGAPGVSKFVQGGRTLYSNVSGENAGDFSRPGVSTISSAALTGGDSGGSPLRSEQPFRPTAANPAPGVTILGGGGNTGFGLRDEDSLARRNAGVGSTSSIASTRDAARVSLKAFDKNFADRRALENDFAKSVAANETAQRGQDIDLEKNRYTADQGLRGQLAQRDAQSARLRFDMSVKKQELDNVDRAFGASRQDAAAAQSIAAENAFQKRLEDKFRTTDANGKDVPDTQKIAAFRTAVEASLGQQIQELTQTGTPAALAKAKELSTRKLAGLDDEDLTMFQQLFDTRTRGEQARGVLPSSGKFVFSDNLFGYRQKREGGVNKGFLNSKVVTDNGTQIPFNDLRYKGGISNDFFFDTGRVESPDLLRGLRNQ